MQWAALFHKGDVRFTSGTELIRFYSPALDAQQDPESRALPCKLSCSHCGSWIADEGRRMFMTFPPLFDFVQDTSGQRPVIPRAFNPSCHIFYNTHVLELKNDLPKFEDDQQRAWVPPAPVNPISGRQEHVSLGLKARDILETITPPLSGTSHKGEQGRMAIVGGSKDYTGAPFYTGMTALRTGAELIFVLAAEEACIPIKTYSAELMVTPIYGSTWGLDSDQKKFVEGVIGVLHRIHGIVIGPGLGRDSSVLLGAAQVIEECRKRDLPAVIDADALLIVTEHPEILKGYKKAIITPNRVEFKRLADKLLPNRDGLTESEEVRQLSIALGGATVVRKGPADIISNGVLIERCDTEGSPRRCGGIGDILAGTLGILNIWAHTHRENIANPEHASVLAAMAGCELVRRECRLAFAKHKRATTAPDIIACVSEVFETLCPAESLK